MIPIRAFFGAGLAVQVPAGASFETNTVGFNALCDLTFANTGGWSCTDDASSTGTWLLNGLANQFEIRWDNLSGTLSTGTAGSWLPLSSDQTFGVTRTTLGNKTCVGTCSIRVAATGIVLASGAISLSASRG